MSRSPLLLSFVAALALGCAAEHENVVHVIAETAPGLKKSAKVLYRGVEVGLVKEVYFTSGGVRIDLVIQRNDVPIRTQDTVRISSIGAFGEQAVDITPGVQTAPLISKGATLPKVVPESTVSLPVSVWRGIVKAIGMGPDSLAKLDSVTKHDSAAKPDSVNKAPARH